MTQQIWIPTVFSFYFYGFVLYLVCLFMPLPVELVHGIVISCLLFYSYYLRLFSLKKWQELLTSAVVMFTLLLSLYFITTHLVWHIWGEKLMDMAFVQNFLRNPMTHTDPWMVGHPLHYYYWGYALWGIWGKITDIPASFAYQIFVSFSFWLYCLTLLGGIYCWVEGKIKRFVLFFSLLLLSNFILFFTNSLTTLSFWKMSRLFSHSTFFMEFPWWSFLMQDFHPHFISLPLLLLSILGVFTFTLERWTERWLVVFLSCGLLLINSWDFIFIFWLYIIVTLLERRQQWRDLLITSGLLFLVLVPLIGFSEIMSGRGIHFGMHHHIETILQGIGRHQFFYLIPLIMMLFTNRNARKEVLVYLFTILLVSLFYFMDPLNSIFKFGQGVTLLATVLFIRNICFTKFFLPIYLGCAGFFAYLHLGIVGPQGRFKYHPLFSKIKQAEVVRSYAGLDHAFLVEWPGKTYDSSRLQLSALVGVPTYLGQRQHLLTRNNKTIVSEIFDRQKILRKVLPYRGREVRLCRENNKDKKIDLTSAIDLNRCELLLED